MSDVLKFIGLIVVYFIVALLTAVIAKLVGANDFSAGCYCMLAGRTAYDICGELMKNE